MTNCSVDLNLCRMVRDVGKDDGDGDGDGNGD